MTQLNQIQIKTFNELSSQQLYEILRLRMKVFCVEQNCPYQDADGMDYQAIHVFIEKENQIKAYARIIISDNRQHSIGRVVVDDKFRGEGLAKAIMKTGINYCLQHKANITLSAQSYLKEFYQSLGFKSLGEYYLEDDIPHEKMQYHT